MIDVIDFKGVEGDKKNRTSDKCLHFKFLFLLAYGEDTRKWI